MRREDLVTWDDLEQAKKEIIDEIRKIAAIPVAAPTPRKLIKSADVLKLIPGSNGKLYNMRIKGEISYVRIGGNIYYEPAEVDRVIEMFRIERKEDDDPGTKRRR